MFSSGAIDLLYRTDDGTGIVDFKTDAVTAEEALHVGERYRLQLGIYAYAVDRAEYRCRFIGDTLPDTRCNSPGRLPAEMAR
jgi:RecB family exonuclease